MDCNKYLMRQLLEVFERHPLDPECEFTGRIELEETTKLLLKKLAVTIAKNASSMWSSPSCHTPLQLYRPELVHILCSIDREYSVFSWALTPNEPMASYLACWFQGLNSSVIMSHDLLWNKLEVRTSTITNEGNGVFQTVPIGANAIFGSYHGTMVNDNMSIGSYQRQSFYGKGSLAIPVKDVARWAPQLQFKTA